MECDCFSIVLVFDNMLCSSVKPIELIWFQTLNQNVKIVQSFDINHTKNYVALLLLLCSLSQGQVWDKFFSHNLSEANRNTPECVALKQLCSEQEDLPAALALAVS